MDPVASIQPIPEIVQQGVNYQAYDKVRSKSKEERDAAKAHAAMDKSMADAKRKSDKLSATAQRAAEGAIDILKQLHGEAGTQVDVPVIRGNENPASGATDARQVPLFVCDGGQTVTLRFFVA